MQPNHCGQAVWQAPHDLATAINHALNGRGGLRQIHCAPTRLKFGIVIKRAAHGITQILRIPVMLEHEIGHHAPRLAGFCGKGARRPGNAPVRNR